MGTIQRVDGSLVEAPITQITHEGDEGSRSGEALIDGQSISVSNSIIDGFTNIWYEQTTVEEWRAWKYAHLLHVQGETYTTQGQVLTPGLRIRRWDTASGTWFEGEVGAVQGFNHVTRARFSFLSLRVPGYALSPLCEGDVVVILT